MAEQSTLRQFHNACQEVAIYEVVAARIDDVALTAKVCRELGKKLGYDDEKIEQELNNAREHAKKYLK